MAILQIQNIKNYFKLFAIIIAGNYFTIKNHLWPNMAQILHIFHKAYYK